MESHGGIILTGKKNEKLGEDSHCYFATEPTWTDQGAFERKYCPQTTS
jgi:hypothetical protein